MGKLFLDAESVPSTPTSGRAVGWIDTTTKRLHVKNDAGAVDGKISNFSTVAQTPGAGSRTYIAGSALAMPTNKLGTGTCFRWRFNMTKTAAGIAASTFDIAVGTGGSSADTARVSFTKPAGTAAIDEADVEIYAICRGPLTASGVFVGEFTMLHNGNTVGHAVIPIVCLNTISAPFDVTVANLIVGLCITSGAGDVITIQLVQAEAWNL